jgi:hypothetical protein
MFPAKTMFFVLIFAKEKSGQLHSIFQNLKFLLGFISIFEVQFGKYLIFPKILEVNFRSWISFLFHAKAQWFFTQRAQVL